MMAFLLPQEKNNTERFPKGYLFSLNKQEKKELVDNRDRFKKLKHSSVSLKVFTEKGLSKEFKHEAVYLSCCRDEKSRKA